ncbi:hypothetical protein PJI17_04040 [Mycobacterium kansasii]|uniref:Uncharacterized protein n=1 Tax=Mycobacterium kansasii TaxID=1768 RepID=A0A1V3X181_MYCKA|nr:hypothetical protein I547_2873 [Mycobacterium kansasii 824]KEP38846.1 hypothetical protein MKSMC1_58310 [Mycobacterium kansasii]OOK72939.1 hypothetical protein BZL29_5306 [Mycobacterium kansasii]
MRPPPAGTYEFIECPIWAGGAGAVGPPAGNSGNVGVNGVGGLLFGSSG